LTGIELRSQLPVRRRDGELHEAPFAFTRHGLPWVIWHPVEVQNAELPPQGFEGCEAVGPGFCDLLAVNSIEAVFAVAIDSSANWRAIRIEGEG
jgi:hypothetical protein